VRTLLRLLGLCGPHYQGNHTSTSIPQVPSQLEPEIIVLWTGRAGLGPVPAAGFVDEVHYDLKTVSDRVRWVSGCSTGCGIPDLRYHCARVSYLSTHTHSGLGQSVGRMRVPSLQTMCRLRKLHQATEWVLHGRKQVSCLQLTWFTNVRCPSSWTKPNRWSSYIFGRNASGACRPI
jgi:hypothetical protein